MISFLNKNSYASSLRAEVNSYNIGSIRVLNKVGFKELNVDSPFIDENFHLSL